MASARSNKAGTNRSEEDTTLAPNKVFQKEDLEESRFICRKHNTQRWDTYLSTVKLTIELHISLIWKCRVQF
jgi:hypothetical protein